MNTKHFVIWWNESSTFCKNHPKYVNKLHSLFKAWNNLMEEYEDAWREVRNLPYIYNEQAEVGLLATAARDTKGLPFIEFSIQKHGQEKDYSGRADLEIYWRKNIYWCLGVEAKPTNISCSSRRINKDLIITIGTALKEAKECANSIRGSYHDCLGLVIGKLIYASNNFNKIQFKKTLLNAASKVKADFCVVHFCDEDIWKNSDHDDCPGITLIGKICGKRASNRGK